MSIFCTTYNLKNLVKEPTCFKNVENPSCIDLILTNKPLYFQSTKVIESGVSDCHKFTITILKSNLVKQEPKIFNYRNYKKFNNKGFRNDLLSEISKKGFHELKGTWSEKITRNFIHSVERILEKKSNAKNRRSKAFVLLKISGVKVFYCDVIQVELFWWRNIALIRT